MRDMLRDLTKYIDIGGKLENVRIVGTASETVFSGNIERMMFVNAKLIKPENDLIGECGMRNIKVLTGLLAFPAYNCDESTFSVRRRVMGGTERPEAFEFRVSKNIGADFRLGGPDVTEPVTIGNIPWDIVVTPEKKSLADFSRLASLFSGVDPNFSTQIVDGRLVFNLGEDNASTQKASMVFVDNVEGNISVSHTWSIDLFLTMTKLFNAHPVELKISRVGIMSVEITTDYATYAYYLRAINN